MALETASLGGLGDPGTCRLTAVVMRFGGSELLFPNLIAPAVVLANCACPPTKNTPRNTYAGDDPSPTVCALPSELPQSRHRARRVCDACAWPRELKPPGPAAGSAHLLLDGVYEAKNELV